MKINDRVIVKFDKQEYRFEEHEDWREHKLYLMLAHDTGFELARTAVDPEITFPRWVSVEVERIVNRDVMMDDTFLMTKIRS